MFWIPLLSLRTDHALALVRGACIGFDGLCRLWPINVVLFVDWLGSWWKTCGRLMLVVAGSVRVSGGSGFAGFRFVVA